MSFALFGAFSISYATIYVYNSIKTTAHANPILHIKSATVLNYKSTIFFETKQEK